MWSGPDAVEAALDVTLAGDALDATAEFALPQYEAALDATLAGDALDAAALFAPPGVVGALDVTLAGDALDAAALFVPDIEAALDVTLAGDALEAAALFVPDIEAALDVTLAGDALEAAAAHAPPPVTASLDAILAGDALAAEATTTPPAFEAALDAVLSGDALAAAGWSSAGESLPGFTEAFRAAFNAQESDEAAIVLLTIDHPDLDRPVRISSDPTERISDDPVRWRTVSRGREFFFLPFRVVLPQDKEGEAPLARLALDNIAREMTALLRSTISPAFLTIEVVLASNPDQVQATFPDYRLVLASWDALSIEFTVTLDGLATEPDGYMRFDPARFPGLFANTVG